MLEFSSSTYPKARKEYKCDLCGEVIHKGEVYHRWSGKYDGDMFDNKYHPLCQRIINAYCEAVDEREYNHGSICDWLRDTYCIDCEHYDYENGECDAFPLSCPLIRKHFEKEGKNNE